MKILIELPTWLGDAVMTTPAIENIVSHFQEASITLIGSSAAIETIKSHPKVVNTYKLDKSYRSFYREIKNLGEFDIFFSFRGSLRAKIMKLCVLANIKFQFDNKIYTLGHQVEKYNNFVNDSINISSIPGNLIIHTKESNKQEKNKIMGINPGASYGDSKRWYPEKFANVITALSNEYDIIIFGGPEEKKIANDIERYLIEKDIKNYQNLAGKTSISDLVDKISNLDLLVTGDSGPMHIAAAFQVPTVAIFGPTKEKETSQWKNKRSLIVKKNLECQPCMKRICPLKHHNCMKLIRSTDVLEAIQVVDSPANC